MMQEPGFGSLWIYMVGPLVGGILAGLISKLDERARDNSGLKGYSEDIILKPE